MGRSRERGHTKALRSRRQCFFRQIGLHPLLVVSSRQLHNVAGSGYVKNVHFLRGGNQQRLHVTSGVGWRALAERRQVFVGPTSVVVQELVNMASTSHKVKILKVVKVESGCPSGGGLTGRATRDAG